MSMLQAFKMAFSSLIGNKLRSFLTMLGMIIGVGAVIAMISLMDGMIAYSMESFSDMGADTLSVSVNLAEAGMSPRILTDDEMYAFVEEHGDVFSAVLPQSSSLSATIKSGDVSMKNQSVSGVCENYAAYNDREIQSGRFLSYTDIRARNKVCVLGTYVSNKLFGGEDPVGQTLRIGNDKYTVVGLLEQKDDSTEYTRDDCIYAPYTTVGRSAGIANPIAYTLKMVDSEHSDAAEELLKDYLYEFYHSSDYYMITNMSSLLDMMESMTGVMENILVGIAGISLLVAGIGIMNIMLVSVSERTKEIGIRKSLGARQRDIKKQFVIEAAVLSSIGGGIGIVIGGIATTALGNVIGIDCAPSVRAIVLSFSVSAGIGLLFGYMPAKRAAKLNPIDALRME
ncbi:MAG: ABC transporter permease [Blautia sp.]|nr:ABC transporter permease [Blautia sp.]